MFDLAVSEYGDLVFSANGDLAGISGPSHLEQCIKVRLKIPRGSWVFDENKRLGSRIHQSLQHTAERAATEIPVFVREALDDMSDITLGDVQITPSADGRQLTIVVGYSVNTLPEGAGEPNEPETEQFIISIPV